MTPAEIGKREIRRLASVMALKSPERAIFIIFILFAKKGSSSCQTRKLASEVAHSNYEVTQNEIIIFSFLFYYFSILWKFFPVGSWNYSYAFQSIHLPWSNSNFGNSLSFLLCIDHFSLSFFSRVAYQVESMLNKEVFDDFLTTVCYPHIVTTVHQDPVSKL